MANLQSFHPVRVNDQSRIDLNLLEYCRRWNVDVEIIKDDDFLIMLSTYIAANANAFGSTTIEKSKRFFANDRLKIGYDIRPIFFSNEPETNKNYRIYIAESFKNNIGSHICYQLACIQLKIKDSNSDPFKSPRFFMYYKNMTLNDVKVPFMSDNNQQIAVCKKQFKNKFKSFDDLILYGDKILHQIGLVNKDGSATFVNNDVKPKVNWFNEFTYEPINIHYEELLSAKYKALLNWNDTNTIKQPLDNK